MASSLLDLPNELLLHIGQMLPDSALSSLILTNRHFTKLLNPILWNFKENRHVYPESIDLPFSCESNIDDVMELLSYAVASDNTPMAKKILQYGGDLHYQLDTDAIHSTLRSAVEMGRDEWVQMLLTIVEDQFQTLEPAFLLTMIRTAMDRSDLAITERLLRHDKIRKESWKSASNHAVQLQNVQLLRIILDRAETEPPTSQEDINRLFHYATIIGHVPSLALLQERGADVNSWAWSERAYLRQPILHDAARRNRIDVVAWMLDHGADINIQGRGETTVVSESVSKVEMLQLLVSRGADIYQPDRYGRPPLVRAFCEHNRDLFLYLLSLQGGARPDFGMDATHVNRCIGTLGKCKSPKMISLLLDHVDLAQRSEDILFWNTRWGNKFLLKELVARGVSLVARRDSDTFLHRLAGSEIDSFDDRREQDKIDVAEFIIDVHPEALSAAGKDGNTPLHLAVHVGRLLMAKALLKWGASPHAVNHQGETPIDMMPAWWGPQARQIFET